MPRDADQQRAAIVCVSRHHGNTRRIAEALAEVLGAEILSPELALADGIERFDVVGFGSGIYFGRHDRSLRQLVETLPRLPPTAFIFSTAGLPWLSWLWHGGLRRRLRRRGCRVAGEFSCAGHDSVGPLAWFGGLNRTRPNAADHSRAQQFAVSLVDRRCASPCRHSIGGVP